MGPRLEARRLLLPLLSLPFLFHGIQVCRGQVSLPLGNVFGKKCNSESEAMAYFGIPYALPPVGELRFRPSQAYNISYPTEGLDATDLPPACSQTVDTTVAQSEDCLFLNVFTPREAFTEPLPVRVLLIGGGFFSDYISNPPYSGCNSVIYSNTIQVSVQYRIGPLGFLSHPATMEESNTTGNWGLLDQQLAMKWVKNHIKFFGGDPNRILLFGVSAGAFSVGFHTTIPSSFGLFHSAIGQSGSPVTIQTALEAFATTKDYSASLNCSSDDPFEEITCLRSQPVSSILTAIPSQDELYRTFSKFQVFFPVVDGTFIPMQPLEAIKQGQFSKVPYLLGFNEDEGSYFIESSIGLDYNVTLSNITNYILTLYPNADPSAVLSLYMHIITDLHQAPIRILINFWTDIFMKCPAQQTLFALANHNIATYQYFWTHTPSCSVFLNWKSDWGACHFCELPFVLHQHPCNLTQQEVDMEDLMSIAWKHMADTQSPKLPLNIDWPQWNKDFQKTIVISEDFSSSYAIQSVGFWDFCYSLYQALGVDALNLEEPNEVKYS